MESPKRSKIVPSFILALCAMAFMVLMAGGASAMGLNDSLIGGLSLAMALIILGFGTFIGILLWGLKVPKLKGAGMGMTVVCLPLIFIIIIAMALTPAAVVPPVDHPAVFDDLAVTPTHGNYTQATGTITVVIVVNSTAKSMNNSATHLTVNVSVQRVDAGETTNVKTITASYAPASVVDPITTDSHSVAKPAADGSPNVNWTLGGTTVSISTRTLTAQMGLTPYATGYITVDITWNGAAFGSSGIAANDVINCGVLTVGGHSYNIQALVSAVWT